MESLHVNQAELFEALTEITINIMKDSADRKTSAYFKRRLETLDAYWTDYKYNHDRLLTEESRSHTYFTNRKYEQAEEVYKKTKVFINQQYQDVLMRSKMEQPSGTSGQQQQSSYQVDQYEAAARLERGGILGVEQGCIIKTDTFTAHSHYEGLSNINIKNLILVPVIEPINHIIDVGISIPQIQNETISDDKDLEDIKKQIRFLKANENLPQQVSVHDIHHYTTFYVVVGAALVVSAVLVVRRIRTRRVTRQAARVALESSQVAARSTANQVLAAAGPSSPSSVDQIYSEVQCNKDQCEKSVNLKVFVDKVCIDPPRDAFVLIILNSPSRESRLAINQAIN
ncbi:unnamed protein product [Leptidea sinapis]|uniref:Uncharacterized protein n=1 Tax=Leptidea sinapis TaxID=189913 RepID=A0A5E4QLF4_9NEOP|nr:unnamed protein product [Leptidea sinapis]